MPQSPKRTYSVSDVITVPGNAFRVKSHLGSGGMGEVYVVKDQNLGTTFVLKLLRREAAKRESLRKGFLDEARVLSRISHPNVVRVLAAGRTLADEDYYVMEQLHGMSVADYAARRTAGGLKTYAAIDLGTQLFRGLRGIHDVGVIHADIKPQNMIIHRAEGDQFLKIIDFGVMRLASDARVSTRFVGTPMYAAPEQIRCEGETTAIDVFGAGVVLFELLAGVRPHADVKRKSELLVRSRTPAPSLATAGRFPDALVRVIDATLSLDPNARPTAAQAVSALEAIAAALPTYDAERMVTASGLVDPSENVKPITRRELENGTAPPAAQSGGFAAAGADYSATSLLSGLSSDERSRVVSGGSSHDDDLIDAFATTKSTPIDEAPQPSSIAQTVKAPVTPAAPRVQSAPIMKASPTLPAPVRERSAPSSSKAPATGRTTGGRPRAYNRRFLALSAIGGGLLGVLALLFIIVAARKWSVLR